LLAERAKIRLFPPGTATFDPEQNLRRYFELLSQL